MVRPSGRVIPAVGTFWCEGCKVGFMFKETFNAHTCGGHKGNVDQVVIPANAVEHLKKDGIREGVADADGKVVWYKDPTTCEMCHKAQTVEKYDSLSLTLCDECAYIAIAISLNREMEELYGKKVGTLA